MVRFAMHTRFAPSRYNIDRYYTMSLSGHGTLCDAHSLRSARYNVWRHYTTGARSFAGFTTH